MTSGGEPFGVPAPTLAKGAPANVSLVDLTGEWQVGEAGYESRSANCAFDGRTAHRPGADDDRRRRRGLPRALLRHRERGRVTPAMLDRERAALVVVDVQEAFRPAVLDFDRVAANTAVLVQGAQAMGVPVVATEQYPQGLGATVPEVAEHLNGAEPIDKTAFSAARAEGFDLAGRDQVLLCGIETHVCVSQTASDLLGQGVEVHVARPTR